MKTIVSMIMTKHVPKKSQNWIPSMQSLFATTMHYVTKKKSQLQKV